MSVFMPNHMKSAVWRIQPYFDVITTKITQLRWWRWRKKCGARGRTNTRKFMKSHEIRKVEDWIWLEKSRLEKIPISKKNIFCIKTSLFCLLKKYLKFQDFSSPSRFAKSLLTDCHHIEYHIFWENKFCASSSSISLIHLSTEFQWDISATLYRAWKLRKLLINLNFLSSSSSAQCELSAEWKS